MTNILWQVLLKTLKSGMVWKLEMLAVWWSKKNWDAAHIFIVIVYNIMVPKKTDSWIKRNPSVSSEKFVPICTTLSLALHRHMMSPLSKTYRFSCYLALPCELWRCFHLHVFAQWPSGGTQYGPKNYAGWCFRRFADQCLSQYCRSCAEPTYNSILTPSIA